MHLVIRTLITFVCIAASTRSDEPVLWQAGVATERVTPDQPMWMAGYASRNRPSEGTALDLYVKALSLRDAEGQRMVFVTCDLISVPRPILPSWLLY